MQDLTIYVDESGNLGRGQGRYFTIACVVMSTSNEKSVHRKMKRLCKEVKENHPNKTWIKGEVKASRIRPEERIELIRRLPQQKINVFYITVDKKWLKDSMFRDKAISYNYWLRLVIDDVLNTYPDCRNLSINIDKRDIKVFSGNSFKDYLNIHLIYERNSDINLSICYPESHCDYGIQIADFMSNGINYIYFSTKEERYALKNAITRFCRNRELFPWKHFGT